MLSLVSKSKLFSVKPSSFFAGLSGYEAYCLDSACALFWMYWEQGKRPKGYEEVPKDPNQVDAQSFL